MEQAFAAFVASDIGCYRYSGTDPNVMNRIGLDYCDRAILQPDQSERCAMDDDSPVEFIS